MNGPVAATSRWQVPRLDRDDRWVGGVAAAIAREIGVQPNVVRAAFVVLATVGGWGLALYAAAWLVLAVATPRRIRPYRPQPKAATPTHRVIAVVTITVGLVVAFLPLADAVFATVVWPVGFVLSGMLIAWTRSEEGATSAVVRVVAGIVVAIGGFLAVTATQIDAVDAAIALVFGLAIVSGIVLVAAPSVVRIARDLDRERQERTRSDERARIGAHIHDSVLQTLTLIQQHGDDPVRTRGLARRQERELRSWLYTSAASAAVGPGLRAALESAGSAVESEFDVTIDVVIVGDGGALHATLIEQVVAAAREAMTNAARHAGVGRVSVFAEVGDDVLDVFVHDEGSGFRPDDVAHDRHGIADSIIGRMERAGGSAVIHSEPGAGTDVELSLPIDVRSVRSEGT